MYIWLYVCMYVCTLDVINDDDENDDNDVMMIMTIVMMMMMIVVPCLCSPKLLVRKLLSPAVRTCI